MGLLIPLAHLGHYLWALYIPPVAVVVLSIVRTTLSERKATRKEEEGKNVRKRRA